MSDVICNVAGESARAFPEEILTYKKISRWTDFRLVVK